jgi:hypothetical protein
MSDEEGSPSFWGSISTTAKAIGAVVATIAAIVALWSQWDKFTGERGSCTISGQVRDSLTQQALPNVRIGYAPNNPHVYAPQVKIDFRTLAVSGSDGTFSGDCKDASDNGDSFEVLAVGGKSPLPGLPCLRTHSTGQHLRNRGEHSGLNIQLTGC